MEKILTKELLLIYQPKAAVKHLAQLQAKSRSQQVIK